MHGTSRCAREGLATLRDPNARLPSGHLGRLRAHWRSAECWHRCLAGPGGQGGCMRPPSCTKSMCSNARDLQTFGTDEVPCKRETCREGLRFAPSQRRAKRARVCTMRTCRLRLHVDFDLRTTSPAPVSTSWAVVTDRLPPDRRDCRAPIGTPLGSRPSGVCDALQTQVREPGSVRSRASHSYFEAMCLVARCQPAYDTVVP